MIEYSLDTEHSVLTVRPSAALTTSDFIQLTRDVDAHLAAAGGLDGIVIDAPSFPGWHNFGAVLSHVRFVHDHHRNVKKVALVTDSHFGDVGQILASHFVAATIRHFASRQLEQAYHWIADDVATAHAGASPCEAH